MRHPGLAVRFDGFGGHGLRQQGGWLLRGMLFWMHEIEFWVGFGWGPYGFRRLKLKGRRVTLERLTTVPSLP